MRKFSIFILLIICSLSGFAQTEATSDSIRYTPVNREAFGGFVFDIDLPAVAPMMPMIDDNVLLGPDATKDYSALFYPDLDYMVYQDNVSDSFYTMGHGGWGSFSHSQRLQVSVFKLGNNFELKTYGQYKADGTKMPNTNVFPWEKNNFVGGMELKNKNFGIRIEVRRGPGNTMFPYFP